MAKRALPLVLLAFLFALALPCFGQARAEGTNLLQNGSFEQIDENGLPVGWTPDMWFRAEGITVISTSGEGSSDGQTHAVINNYDDNDARLAQAVAVEPDSYYRLSGDIWAIGCYSENKGANLTVEGIAATSEEVHDAIRWRHVELVGRTGPKQKEIVVWCRLGGYGSENMGEAHFDNIKLEKLDATPADYVTFEAMPVSAGGGDSGTDDGAAKDTRHLVPTLVMVSLLYAALCAWGYFWLQSRRKAFQDVNVETVLIIAMGIALAVRFFFGLTTGGHETDINCFKAWSIRMFDKGPWGFYAEDYFADYPPGYMLILYPIGLIRAVFNIDYDAKVFDLLIKMPAILCDVAAAYLVYKIARRFKVPNIVAAALAIGLLFNPALIHNSSMWAQIDSVLALALLLSTYWLLEERFLAGSLMYVVAFLIKPQALMLGPSLLLVYLYAWLAKKRTLSQLVTYIGICVGAFLLACIPFWGGQPWYWILDKYFGTMSNYAYGSVNAFNLFAMLGFNWVSQDTPLAFTAASSVVALLACIAAIGYALYAYSNKRKRAALYGAGALLVALLLILLDMFFHFIQIPLVVVGHTLFAAALLLAAYVFVRATTRDRSLHILPLIGAFVVFAFYCLEVRQHERYMFPVLLLLPLAYVTLKDRRILYLFLACTISQLLNSAIVLDVTHVMPNLPFLYAVMRVISALNLVLFGYMVYVMWSVGVRGVALEPGVRGADAEGPSVQLRAQPQTLSLPTLRSLGDGSKLHMKRIDYIVLIGITLVYSVVAFVNLGSMTAPQSEWKSTSKEETLVFDLGEVRPISRIYYDVGICSGKFTAEVSYDGIEYTPFNPHYQPNSDGGYDTVLDPIEIEDNTMFRWLVHDVAEPTMGRYVRIQPQSIGLVFLEMAFTDSQGNAYPIASVENTGSRNDPQLAQNLIDEQDTVPQIPSYYNGTYFDEIYHARTAYEMMNNMHWYETTHPPLGKAIIEIGIALFGMTPFGWRFSGTVVGILMIPVLYLLLKVLFKRTNLAAAGTLLFTFDFMHFTQTRIATIDSYGVFFILLMYLFMFLYMKRSFLHEKLGRTLVPLFLCGLSMGLGIASKWIDVYAAVGLAVLLFYTLFQRYLQYREACRELDDAKKVLTPEETALFQDVRRTFWRKLLITLGCCVVFFIAIPLAIYIASYWQYFTINNEPHTLKDIWKAQQYMFDYHSGLTDDHPYASPWWEWLVDWKPMWYFSNSYLPKGMTSGISAFGNPAVWWFGLFALIWSIVRFVLGYGRKDKRYVWLLVGFAVNFLPWVLVPRSMFIYHYFASVPFLVMCIMMFFEDLLAARKNGKRWMWGFVAAAIVLFILFYPATSGMPVPSVFARTLKWLPSWVLFSV